MKKFLIVLLLFSAVSCGSMAWGLNISLGANIARHELNILKKDDTSVKAAKFRSNFYVSPAIHIHSSETYFGDSRFGWKMEFNLGSIDMSTQVDSGQEVNIDTRVTGLFGHFNPILFYRLGDRRSKGVRHWRLTGGLGYGLSYLVLDGTFETTEVHESEQKMVTINRAQGFSLLPSALLEFNWYRFFAKISTGFDSSGFVVGDYNYQLLFRSVSLGYVVDF